MTVAENNIFIYCHGKMYRLHMIVMNNKHKSPNIVGVHTRVS